MRYLAPGITAMDSHHLSKDNTGLGNVMFQIATAYGLAKDTGCEFSSFYLKQFAEKLQRLFGFQHGDTIFKGFLQDSNSTIPPTETIIDAGGKKYDPQVIQSIQKSTSECIKLEGHFESPSYFHKYRDEILERFNVKQFENFIRSNIPPLFDPSFTPISLHVRNATDAVQLNHGFYKHAVEMISSFVSNPYFFLFVDDIHRVPFSPESIGIKQFMSIHSQEDFLDLFIMSYCKYHIASISTFSWWGSYLSTFPDKRIFVSREAAQFCMVGNNISEEEYLHNYFLGNAVILPNY